MTLITLQDGKLVLRDGRIGTEQACCCEPGVPETGCPRVGGGNGWYTENHKEDLTQFLLDSGYTNPLFIPTSFAEGAPVPYTDGCGQTWYYVDYECCGQSGPGSSCDPAFSVRSLRDAGGAGGNQFPPCFLINNDTFLYSCCEEEPPP
jgi:hypothetical protein